MKTKIPGGRSDHASIIYRDYIITFGGYNGNFLNDIIVFDPDKDAWAYVQPVGLVPIERSCHTMCLIQDNYALVYGGNSVDGRLNDLDVMVISFNDRFSFNLEKAISIEWRTLNTDGPYRACHTAVSYKNSIYAFGGADEDFQSTNQLWEFDFQKLTWTECKTTKNVPGERGGHCSALYKNIMVVFGGWSTQKKKWFDDLHMIDLETMKWDRIAPRGTGPGPRIGTSVQEIAGKIYFFGGCKNPKEPTDELFVYSTATNSWKQIQTGGKPPLARSNQTALGVKNRLIVWGGLGTKSEYLSDIYSLRLLVGGGDETQISEAENILEDTLRAQHGDSVLKELFLDKMFSDVIFEVEGQEFPAHKAIISKACSYFKDMFTDDRPVLGPTKVPIPNMEANTFKDIRVNENLAMQLLFLGEKLSVADLKHKSEEFLAKIITIDNFTKLANTAENLRAPILKEGLLQFAAGNMERLKARDDLYDLPKSILVELFSKMNISK